MVLFTVAATNAKINACGISATIVGTSIRWSHAAPSTIAINSTTSNAISNSVRRENQWLNSRINHTSPERTRVYVRHSPAIAGQQHHFKRIVVRERSSTQDQREAHHAT